MGTASI
ncbi:Protein of unknown function [Bacillus cytotoxicus]|nr:Protein of unknown function [Bacillus cytotoxicus]SCN41594.1 Protein of unknown function [Bacillus cytotoxicus]